jgi:hypothetical protein
MKLVTIYFCIISLSIFGCNNADTKKENAPVSDSTAVADSSAKTTATNATTAAMPDSATMMKNWQDYMAVSDMQKMMASWGGTWSADITMWEHPDVTPQKTKGIAINKMIMGGRYQVSTNTSMMMGMPFEGQSTLGFDNAKKIFISTWIDNMGTGIMVMKGPWNSATKSIMLSGSMVDPTTGNEVGVRENFTIIDDKTQLMEMFVTGADGKEFKNMEIKYSKK